MNKRYQAAINNINKKFDTFRSSVTDQVKENVRMWALELNCDISRTKSDSGVIYNGLDWEEPKSVTVFSDFICSLNDLFSINLFFVVSNGVFSWCENE